MYGNIPVYESKKNPLIIWFLTLKTQCTIYIENKVFFDTLTKGFIIILKRKGGRQFSQE